MNTSVTKRMATAGVALCLVLAVSSMTMANALATGTPVQPAESDSAQVRAIISAGDREISRRLKTLGTLNGKITNAARLTASDKTALSDGVSSEIAGLTTLKTKLDTETTLAGAKADVQSMIADYRVYALIMPKVELVKVADDQQVVENKLTDLAVKLQKRITSARTSGKDVTDLQAKLTDMTTKTQAAQAISNSVEAKVIALQPSDYDSNHAVLSGYRDQLKTARADMQTAYADAKAIVAGLKTL